MVRLSNVRKVFNAGEPNEWVALDGVNLSIEPGRITALTGPSGSGKTTLLTLMGCMARPTSGRIWLDGQEITSLPERFLTEIRRETFGFIFQQFNLIKGSDHPRQCDASGVSHRRAVQVSEEESASASRSFRPRGRKQMQRQSGCREARRRGQQSRAP